MSNEEAILVLQNDAYVLYEDDSPYDRQAYYMAIKALEEKRIKTNADRIRSMSDEELAQWLAKITDCGECNICGHVKCMTSEEACACAWRDWLKQEAKE